MHSIKFSKSDDAEIILPTPTTPGSVAPVPVSSLSYHLPSNLSVNGYTLETHSPPITSFTTTQGSNKRQRTEEEEEDDDDSLGTEESSGGNKIKKAGRRKISIEFIADKSRRHITFSKRKTGIMKKAYELSVLTGTQVLLLIVSETGLVYTFTTPKLQPLVSQPEGKNLIQACLNAPDIHTAFEGPMHLPPHHMPQPPPSHSIPPPLPPHSMPPNPTSITLPNYMNVYCAPNSGNRI